MGLLPSSQSTPQQLSFSHPYLFSPSVVSRQGQECLRVLCAVEGVQYTRWKASLSAFRNPNHLPAKLLVPLEATFSQSGICSSTGTAEIIYENYTRLLSEELFYRTARGYIFTEPELWELLLYLVGAEREAQACWETLGDVRPDNVFLNGSGRIRIGGRLSWPGGRSAFEKGVDKIAAFVSPEDMEALSTGAMQPCERFASDIFAIGLTLLSLANRVNYDSLYNMGERKMNLSLLKQDITALRKKSGYSQILRCIITNLCSIAPANRMGSEELWTMLGKHETQIAGRQTFTIDNAPAKLHKEVEALRAFVADNPMLFATPQLLSEAGGSGLVFPEHLDVHRVVPEYVFEEKKTIIKHLE